MLSGCLDAVHQDGHPASQGMVNNDTHMILFGQRIRNGCHRVKRIRVCALQFGIEVLRLSGP